MEYEVEDINKLVERISYLILLLFYTILFFHHFSLKSVIPTYIERLQYQMAIG